ncbi:MAG: hypothetical protein OEW95_10955 [Candidatus Bathyarchaeota archaeon]|nr:hypothetical protein [Candidatus Bathyarchaeota archaeon]MDH5664055.1 hypothetical protein [Candidatus Bathyarchaeota archaeon]
MPLVQHALKTQKRWTAKDANLGLLTENIESFFKSKGFETRKNALRKGYRISTVPKHVRDVKAGIKVTILGGPHDFMVELSVGETSRFSTLLGLSTIPFGGGTLVLRGLKLQEALERLEKEFWVHVEEAIPCVTGSHSEGNAQSP